MPLSLQSFLWGLLAGSALVLGAGLGYFFNLPRRAIAAVMAFGSGVLISALSFELMEKAMKAGGFDATACGFLGGALVYTGANWVLSHRGAKFRKHSGDKQATEAEQGGSGTSIALGALLDGIPESIVIVPLRPSCPVRRHRRPDPGQRHGLRRRTHGQDPGPRFLPRHAGRL